MKKRSFWKNILSASLSPNTESEDIVRAYKVLFAPWSWKSGAAITKVEGWFRAQYNVGCAVSFNSGRSALLALLRSFDIGKGDEVIIQAFTCVAVPNSVRWAGAKPIFVDIDETYNLSCDNLKKNISSKTRAIIVQHTFGVPANMKEILDLAKKHKCIVIEDCAHALGGEYEGKKLGSLGDAAFFSFGRDKIVSSVFGGLAIIQPKYEQEIARLKTYHKTLPYPSPVWVVRQLIHPIAFAFILSWYRIGIGKLVLVLLQKIGLLSFPVYAQEVKGAQPKDFPARYPNALAQLLLLQLKKLGRYNKERVAVARWYRSNPVISGMTSLPEIRGAIYLRFPIQISDPATVIKKSKQAGILLGNWYQHVVDPAGVVWKNIGYISGSCPNAEKTAKTIVNLPTRISIKDAIDVANSL